MKRNKPNPNVSYLNTEQNLYNNAYNQLDEFDKNIAKHLYIDYKYSHTYTERYVNEDYKTYKYLRDLCALITSDIMLQLDKFKKLNKWRPFQLHYDKNNFKELKDIFFENATINSSYSNNTEANYTADSQLNDKTNLLDNIFIELYICLKDTKLSDNICKKLMHEFTHAYDKYHSLMEKSSIFDISKDIVKSIKYSKDGDENEYNRYLKDVLYFTMDLEQNAFENELISELESNKTTIKTHNDALRVLRELPIYNAYKNLLINIAKYKKNELSDDAINSIVDTYNSIFKMKLNDKAIFKKLEDSINNSIKRFESTIGDLCLEHLNNLIIFSKDSLYLKEHSDDEIVFDKDINLEKFIERMKSLGLWNINND